jgi:hypothetical protein
MDLAYSPQGLKSRPKECSNTTLLVLAVAAADHAKKIIKPRINPAKRQAREAFQRERRLGHCAITSSFRTLQPVTW